MQVTDNGDGTHTVAYTPSLEGPYSAVVKYADQEIPRRYKHTHVISVEFYTHTIKSFFSQNML